MQYQRVMIVNKSGINWVSEKTRNCPARDPALLASGLVVPTAAGS